jgi:hypothetical protein
MHMNPRQCSRLLLTVSLWMIGITAVYAQQITAVGLPKSDTVQRQANRSSVVRWWLSPGRMKTVTAHLKIYETIPDITTITGFGLRA